MSTDPSLDDALYLVEAHAKNGCMYPQAAFDYSHRIDKTDFDRMRRGWDYIVARVKAADKHRQGGA